ncbi:hypothetical protein AQUCO_06000003v1 [Aquilegia coerulea]|uniref:Uncharacterized protein n=1 Tax=Aquilegia coerulea TaxID=218851 RepID=A0A2G5CDI0_AQUCA|nr:hypothetical protein AQUCO_06000003v1 [Aquilegia coerulea]
MGLKLYTHTTWLCFQWHFKIFTTKSSTLLNKYYKESLKTINQIKTKNGVQSFSIYIVNIRKPKIARKKY